MAQPVFDDHPIEEYLRESGEILYSMPGGLLDLIVLEENQDSVFDRVYNTQWISTIVQTIKRFLRQTGARRRPAATEFAERFKYLVISSSLLSTSLSFSSVRKPTKDQPEAKALTSPALTLLRTNGLASRPLAITLACLLPAAFAHGNIVSGLFLLAAVKVLLAHHKESSEEESGSWNVTLETLEGLITANNTWEETICDSFNFLEEEEEDFILTGSSHAEAFRLIMSSTLANIQSQCDDIRQLFTTLTSPFSISQLSHMYAPPAPAVSPSVTSLLRPVSISGPPSPLLSQSDAYSHLQTGSKAASANKRATWTGAYTLPTRGTKRRSKLSTFIPFDNLKPSSGLKTATSAPATPNIREDYGSLIYGEVEGNEEPFGVAALDLRRRRRRKLFSMLPSSREQYTNTLLTSSIGSRFTSLDANLPSSRSPPSLETLNLALQATLGAKRFACAHLLALRFAEANGVEGLSGTHRKRFRRRRTVSIDSESDEAYWENVRSIINLLTLALHECSSRLRNALDDVIYQQKDGLELEQQQEIVEERSSQTASDRIDNVEPPSFAPIPSHLARFSTHASALFVAFDDARSHLEECLSSLQDISDSGEKNLEAPMQLYDRMRHELGVALREWERGKKSLQALTEQHHHNKAKVGETQWQDNPRQDEQLSSGESDRTMVNLDEDPENPSLLIKSSDISQEPDQGMPVDNATSHHLDTATTEHLLPPGIEEVFETVAVPPQFNRPRSTLSREERIRLARARHEGDLNSSSTVQEKSKSPGWGPGGEVVEELKDVIRRVSEQRRLMMVSRTKSNS